MQPNKSAGAQNKLSWRICVRSCSCQIAIPVLVPKRVVVADLRPQSSSSNVQLCPTLSHKHFQCWCLMGSHPRANVRTSPCATWQPLKQFSSTPAILTEPQLQHSSSGPTNLCAGTLRTLSSRPDMANAQPVLAPVCEH